jgi:hypothetical protein
MVEAFIRSRTSPWAGVGTETGRISTVLSPGKNAALIVSFIAFISLIGLLRSPILNVFTGL